MSTKKAAGKIKKVKSLQGFKAIPDEKGIFKYQYMVNSAGTVINGETKAVISPRKRNKNVVQLCTKKTSTDRSIDKLVEEVFSAKRLAAKKVTRKRKTTKVTKQATSKKNSTRKRTTTLPEFSQYKIYKSGKVINIKSKRELKSFYVNANARKMNRKAVAMRDDAGKIHKFAVERLVERAFA